MKFSTVFLTTLVVTMVTAYPRNYHRDETSRLERLNHFLDLLPEDLRQEVEDTVRTAIINGERPQISDDLRAQIREHMGDLREQHRTKLIRLLSMLPEDLRLQVDALLDLSLSDGKLPQASEELRNKIQEHFAVLKAMRRQRLDKFLTLIPEELRQEVEELLQRPLVNGERPHASPELREKIREHLQALKGEHQERLERFLAMLPEDIRQEVQEVVDQDMMNGEKPRAPEELREKIREHLQALKGEHLQRLERFLAMLPDDLRQEVQQVVNQGLVNGEKPRAPEELREKIREHFQTLKGEHLQRFERFLAMLPEDLRQEAQQVMNQGLANGEKPQAPEELREKIREHFQALKGEHQLRLERFLAMLPEDLRQEAQQVVDQGLINGEKPHAPEELREKIREHFQTLKGEHVQKLERFLAMLPQDLRQEVQQMVDQGFVNGEKPHAPEELREKIREHFQAMKGEHLERLDRFLAMLPEDLRYEAQQVVNQGLVNGEKPRAPEELREKIREHFQALKGEHLQRLERFLAILPEDLRQEVQQVVDQGFVNGEKPHAPEELREKIREHFQALKGEHLQRLERFLAMLPEDLRQGVQEVVNQGFVNGEKPRAPEELRDKIREHFNQLKENHRDQLELLLNYLPMELRQQVKSDHGRPLISEELWAKIREFFDRLLPADLLAEIQKLKESGVPPMFSEDFPVKLQQFLQILMRPLPF